MLLKQKGKNKAKLEIPLADDSFFLDLTNVPGTDVYLIQKKNDYIKLCSVVRQYITEIREWTESDYLSYYNTRLGFEFTPIEECMSTNDIDRLSINSNPQFSGKETPKSTFEIEKYYDEQEMEYVNKWNWKTSRKNSDFPDVHVVPTIQVPDDLESGYKKLKMEHFDDPLRSASKSDVNNLLPNDFGFFSDTNQIHRFNNLQKDSTKKSLAKTPKKKIKKGKKGSEKQIAFPMKIEYLEEQQKNSDDASLSQLNEEPLPTTFYDNEETFNHNQLIVGKDGSLMKCCPESQLDSLDYGYIHKSNIMSLVTTHDNEFIFTGGNNGELRQWRCDSELQVHDYSPAHKYWIRAMSVTPDDKYLFTGSEDFVLKQWDIQGKKLYKQYLDYAKHSIDSMIITSNMEFLFTGTHNGCLKKLALKKELTYEFGEKASERKSRPIHKAPVKSLLITKDNEYLLSADKSGTIVQWSVSTHTFVREFPRFLAKGITTIHLTEDGNRIVSVLGNQTLIAFPLSEMFAGHTANDKGKKKNQMTGQLSYGSIYNGNTFYCAPCRDNLGFYTISTSGVLKKYSYIGQRLLRDYGTVIKSQISSIKLLE